MRATGTFTVAMKPLSTPPETDGTKLSHMGLEKSFAGDLVAMGLRGTFVVEIVDGQHRYTFDYTLPAWVSGTPGQASASRTEDADRSQDVSGTRVSTTTDSQPS